MAHVILHLCTCSDTEYALYEEECFTKSTRNGCRVFSDLFVELTIKLIRSRLGHRVAGQSHEQRVRRTIYFLKEIVDAARPFRESQPFGPAPARSSFDEPGKEQQLGKTFDRTYEALGRMQVWDDSLARVCVL